jgi:ATP-dependent helicase/nuclease subunit A
MRLAAELAVKDLTALLAFLATPEDDLSLAAILRSPLFGWSEVALHDLAYDRKGFLWRALQERAGEFSDTVAMLVDLRDRADFLRPYDLLERVLIRHDGRRRLLARLGQEAEDGIDAMLAQALAYERMDVPSLTGFVGWLQADDVQIKRDPGSAGDQIRVMSVHGAKGLEAPVVILPDTAYRQGGHPGPALLVPAGGPVIWTGAKDDCPTALQPLFEARAEREAEERNRLLYVAMTRAESWLITCAAGKIETKDSGSWYTHIRDAATEMGATEQMFFDEPGQRIEAGDWSGGGSEAEKMPEPEKLPDWTATPPKPPARAITTLSPSDLGGEKSLPGDGLTEDAAMARGRRLHLLLEHLPQIAPAAWDAATPGILAAEGDLTDPERAELFQEALTCLTAPHLAHVFAPDALAEVTLTADSDILGRKLMGQIDRLILSQGRILAVDFKSNAMVPARAEDTPDGLLRQMGAYAEMLAAIYPGQPIETAILWTREARLMVLPHDLVMAALHRAEGA